MADYISRASILSKLKAKFCAYCTLDACDTNCKLHYLLDAVKAEPAADVRPVAHGHYVGEYDGYADGNPVYDMWYCSECGCCFEDWDEKPTYNYCPNCGADMREVKADG